jgi:hypothetical protein
MRAVALTIVGLVLAGCGGLAGERRVELPAEFRECRPETYALLEERGIARNQITSFFSQPERVIMRRPDDDNDRIVGYSNWVRVDGCDGSLVFRFNRACQFRYAYATGDCALPGNGTE